MRSRSIYTDPNLSATDSLLFRQLSSSNSQMRVTKLTDYTVNS